MHFFRAKIDKSTTFSPPKIAKKALLDSLQLISHKILRMTENLEISTLWYLSSKWTERCDKIWWLEHFSAQFEFDPKVLPQQNRRLKSIIWSQLVKRFRENFYVKSKLTKTSQSSSCTGSKAIFFIFGSSPVKSLIVTKDSLGICKVWAIFEFNETMGSGSNQYFGHLRIEKYKVPLLNEIISKI